MIISNNPHQSEWQALCNRPFADDPVVRQRVESIIARVEADGDKALVELAQEIDGVTLKSLAVSKEEIEVAICSVSEAVKTAIAQAAENIRKFHAAQIPQTIAVETMQGVRCMQKPIAIEKVGLYIPGGTAPLFSTVLMLAIPAQIAECKQVVLCTPTRRDGSISPEVLYTAHVCGIRHIYKVGGAGAVAAMAFGTESIAKVDKIFGPGNRYVTTAKQILSGRNVAIDMPAGPSEVMVIADDASRADFVAADMLSQAEHGVDSQAILVCRSVVFAQAVQAELTRQTELLERKDFIRKSLENSLLIVFNDDEEVIHFANTYAAEHLIISVSDAWKIADRITAAGSIFVGQYTPESAGDYASGTNHTLPTCGWARSFSGVNIDSFMRKMTIQEISHEGLENLSATIVNMAQAEGLEAHANAVKIRLQ